ncbi:glycoside hydrolase family 32 protein [Maribacter chungangensis]|uniref:Glycoside hydrolase family 32 protein n=1 Tax=Maribacter chungangensis TaxID=1069117 RepID=A0ABW3B747_9FLAO
MPSNFKITFVIALAITFFSCKEEGEKKELVKEEQGSTYYMEPYRPQFHFTPEEKWMNDPNGLVYHKGVYHLFYQYYPDDIVWGPMHWGHAVSKDMVHWEHKPIALYPDENGLIFSGSAVLDINNTSGFGTKENPALVAIFTYHLMEGEKAGRKDFQTQGIAYSLDNGDSWMKYEGNPVIGNYGIKDFRDPKVFWNEKEELWTMLLVAGDHLQIWNSPNLKEWEYVSEFGKDQGAHGGVWECPDLFPLQVEGTDEVRWVLLISINPGAPNGGSGTQYFVGDFDGKTFTSDQKENKWLDLGRDNYAGVTYNNTPNNERIFIGWMSNWDYARDTPTEKWRSAMTVPRTLSLHKPNGNYELNNYPIPNFESLLDKGVTAQDIPIAANRTHTMKMIGQNQSEIRFTTTARDFVVSLKNDSADSLAIAMDGKNNMLNFDRRTSGLTDFKDNFATGVQKMPMPNLPDGPIEIRILLDASSIELFVNQGQYVMTNQIFPRDVYTKLEFLNRSNKEIKVNQFSECGVKRVW